MGRGWQGCRRRVCLRPFTPYAVERAFHASQGQPWLVNAPAYEIIQRMQVPVEQPITDELMNQAVERLIVIEPVIAGGLIARDVTYNDDLAYARDLGLIAREPPVRIANPIYQEVVLRVLSASVEDQITIDRNAFLLPDGRLGMAKVLDGFLKFWRCHGEILESSETYHEAACHLIFMAWLHRVVNGGGVIDREYALGRDRPAGRTVTLSPRLTNIVRPTDGAPKDHVRRAFTVFSRRSLDRSRPFGHSSPAAPHR